MGNALNSKSVAAVGKVNLDDIDLESLDESKSLAKDNKKTRKSKEYKTLRTVARTGIDEERRVQLWMKATNAKPNYSKMYDTICSDLFADMDMNDFPQFPKFGSACTFALLQNTNDKSLLHASQRILLVLAIEHDSLKYCPQLGYIVELMLTVQNSKENIVFSICHSMLVASAGNNWYFRTDYFNSYVRIRTFLSIFEENVKFVASFLKQNKMDISNMLADAISTMFVEYLNPETYMRLVDTFCVEGYKILFRVGVALLNHASVELVKCKNLKDIKKVLIAKSQLLKPKEMCDRCFSIYLTRNKFEKLDSYHRNKGFHDNELNKIEEESYVRRWPTWDKKVIEQSNIMDNKGQFMQLWVWLPPGCHIGDYNMLFSTKDHGYRLKAVYEECKDKENLIVVIKTTSGEVIGAFVTTFDDVYKDKYAPLKYRLRDAKAFLFVLHNNDGSKEKEGNDAEVKNNDDDDGGKDDGGFKSVCYYAKTSDHYYHNSNFELKNMHTQRELDGVDDDDGGNDNENKNDDNDDGGGDASNVPIVYPQTESLQIGDGENNCIYLDDSLNHGFSVKSGMFNSPSLVTDDDGQFQIAHLEVWCVQ